MTAPEDNRSLNRYGATQLAARIRHYWREQGFEIQTFVERIETNDRADHTMYAVRSNLCDGLPPR